MGPEMKIVPNTEHWNDGEMDWRDVPNAAGAVVGWEERSQTQLPLPYREFILKYNGGSIYPRMFKFSLQPDFEQEELLYRIYRWDEVLSCVGSSPVNIPPEFLKIAETPGPVEVLISVHGEDFGKIYAWIRSNAKWGTDSNQQVYLLADSFTVFLEMLYDDSEQSDYDNWYIPAYKTVMKDLEL